MPENYKDKRVWLGTCTAKHAAVDTRCNATDARIQYTVCALCIPWKGAGQELM